LGTWTKKRDEYLRRSKRELVAEDVRMVRSVFEEHDWDEASDEFEEIVCRQFERIEQEVESDLETLSETDLAWKYIKSFWECIAVFV